MSGTKRKAASGSNSSSSKMFIAFIVFILIMVIGIAAYLLLRNRNGEPKNTRDVGGSARLIMDEGDAGNIMDEMRKEVEEGMFECNMSSTWTFADGTSESKDAAVANSTNNSYPFYFDVMLEDTGEIVYSSPVVPVGAQVTGIKLEKDLDPGEYEATVLYSLLEDEESQEVKSQAGFVITITVLK